MTNWLLQTLIDSADACQPAKIFYRLYHDDLGRPLFYSMEDLPGTYIEIDRSIYEQGRYDITVVNGRLRSNQSAASMPRKLAPADTGTPCHPDDVMIVDPHSNRFWQVKTYEN